MYSITMQPRGTGRRKSRSAKVRLLLAVFTTLLLLGLRPAAAQAPAARSHPRQSASSQSTSPTAQDFFKQGNEASRREKWDEAIAAYKKALALKPGYRSEERRVGKECRSR